MRPPSITKPREIRLGQDYIEDRMGNLCCFDAGYIELPPEDNYVPTRFEVPRHYRAFVGAIAADNLDAVNLLISKERGAVVVEVSVYR